MLSVAPRHSGRRVNGLCRISRTQISGGSSALIARMLVRWIMMSEISSSPRSSTPPSRSRSALMTEPSRCSRSTAPRSSSCAESIDMSDERLTPKRNRMRRTMPLTRLDSGPATATKGRTSGATASAKRSGDAIAQLFGSTSEKITSSTVMTTVAIATPELPSRPISRLVVKDEARMLTRLLPIKSAPISLIAALDQAIDDARPLVAIVLKRMHARARSRSQSRFGARKESGKQ